MRGAKYALESPRECSQIAEHDLDPLALGRLSIGNMGYSESDVAAGIVCPEALRPCGNVTHYAFFGDSLKECVLHSSRVHASAHDTHARGACRDAAAAVVAVSDVLASAVFGIFMLYFGRRIRKVVRFNRENSATATQYAVRVYGASAWTWGPQVLHARWH